MRLKLLWKRFIVRDSASTYKALVTEVRSVILKVLQERLDILNINYWSEDVRNKKRLLLTMRTAGTVVATASSCLLTLAEGVRVFKLENKPLNNMPRA